MTELRRSELQTLAHVRIDEARVLLDASMFSGAYYLAGYSIECGLKACIARKIKGQRVQSKGFERDFFVHDLKKLAETAGLLSNRKLSITKKQEHLRSLIEPKWSVVQEWNEAARYQEWDQKQASDMVMAVSHPTEGVLQWLQSHW